MATDALELDQLMEAPVIGSPAAVRAVAVRDALVPAVSESDEGLTTTDATVGAVEETVTAEVPLFPSLVAVIVVEPAAIAVTNPLPFTVATAVLLDAHVIVRPASTLPPASLSVAASCVVCPTAILTVAGLTVTDATGATSLVVALTTFDNPP